MIKMVGALNKIFKAKSTCNMLSAICCCQRFDIYTGLRCTAMIIRLGHQRITCCIFQVYMYIHRHAYIYTHTHIYISRFNNNVLVTCVILLTSFL